VEVRSGAKIRSACNLCTMLQVLVVPLMPAALSAICSGPAQAPVSVSKAGYLFRNKRQP
jgi:hypothetical protein